MDACRDHEAGIYQIIKDIDGWTDVLIARIEGKKVATNTKLDFTSGCV